MEYLSSFRVILSWSHPDPFLGFAPILTYVLLKGTGCCFFFNGEKYLKGRVFERFKSQVTKIKQVSSSVIITWVHGRTTERESETVNGLFSLEKWALFLPIFKYLTMRCFLKVFSVFYCFLGINPESRIQNSEMSLKLPW